MEAQKFREFITEGEIKPYRFVLIWYDDPEDPDDPEKTADKLIEEGKKLGCTGFKVDIDGAYSSLDEEKIARQEEAIIGAEEQIEVRRVELSKKIDEVHSRVTETAKEHSKEILILRNDINNRVGVLEKWRHVLIGASIVIGFILHKVVNWS